MKLWFHDSLADYIRSLGIARPVKLAWDAADFEWGEDPNGDDGPTSYHTVVSGTAPPDDTGEWDYHEIGLDRTDPSLRSLLMGLRHELEHCRQIEALGYYEYHSSRLWFVEILCRQGGPNPAAQYRWNPYEIEANAAMEAEWADLLPYVKGLDT